MENFAYQGKTLKFWTLTGEVLSSSKRSETHVSSSGGGGYVGRGGGYVSAPTVSSNTITKHEFWLRTPDDQEVAVKLSGVDIPLREGQKVTMICVGSESKSDSYYAVLLNHSANQHFFIKTGKELNQNYKITAAGGLSYLKHIGILLGGVMVSGIAETGIFFLGAAGYTAYRLFKRNATTNKLVKELDTHLEQLAQQTYRL